MPWERKTVEEQRNEFAEAATPLCSLKNKQAPHKPYFRAFAELVFSFFTFGDTDQTSSSTADFAGI